MRFIPLTERVVKAPRVGTDTTFWRGGSGLNDCGQQLREPADGQGVNSAARDRGEVGPRRDPRALDQTAYGGEYFAGDARRCSWAVDRGMGNRCRKTDRRTRLGGFGVD